MRTRTVVIVVLFILMISPIFAATDDSASSANSRLLIKNGTLYEVSGSELREIANNVTYHVWLNLSSVHYLLYSTGQNRLGASYLLIYDGLWSKPMRVGGAYPAISANGTDFMVTSVVNGTLFVYYHHAGSVIKKSIGAPEVSVSASYLGIRKYVMWRQGDSVYMSLINGSDFSAPVKIAGLQYPVRRIFVNGTHAYFLEESLHSWVNVTYSTNDYLHWHRVSERSYAKSRAFGALDDAGLWNPPHLADWTFMVYMDADNNLGGYYDIHNIEGMESGFNASANGTVNVIVLWDGPKNGDTKLISIHAGGYTDISSSATSWLSSEMNMSNPETLIDFVNWTERNYPAHHYFLDMWDHGGDYGGAMYDATSGYIMSLAELRTAADGILRATGHPVDIWGYDACLMDAGADNYQIKEAANIIVASEHTEEGWGWNYRTVLGNLTDNPGQNATEFAYNFVNNVDPTHQSIVTMAAINVTRWDYFFMPAYNQLAQALRRSAGTHSQQIQDAMNSTVSADVTYWPTGKDVGDFAKQLLVYVNDSSVRYWAERVLENVSKSVINYFDYDTNGRKIIMAETDSTYQASTHLGAYIFRENEWDEMLDQVYINGTDDPDIEPTCTVTSNVPASLPQNSHLVINGTAADPDGSVETVEMKIDRGNWQVINGTDAWSVNISLLNFNVGTHYLFFRAYDGNLYSNVSYVRIRVTLRTDLPDLVFSGVSISSVEPDEGESVYINATVMNVGNNSSYDVQVGVYLDNALTPLFFRDYGNITPGNFTTQLFVWNTSGFVGFHRLYIVIDPNNTIEELNESNNIYQTNMTVQGYGVRLYAGQSSEYLHPGNNTSFAVTVVNAGTYPDTYNLSFNYSGNCSVVLSTSVLGLPVNGSAVMYLNVSVPQNATPDFTVNISVFARSQNDSSKSASLNLTVTVIPDMLFVYESTAPYYFETALNDSGFEYDTWNLSAQGEVTASVLERYGVVLWSTGSKTTDVLTQAEQSALSYYLDAGGKLYLSSQGLLDAYSNAPAGGGVVNVSNEFINDYLHVQGGTTELCYGSVTGVAGDAVGGYFNVLNFSYPFQNDSASLRIEPGAYPVFTHGDYTTAVRYANSTYRIVYTAFSFEAVENNSPVTGGALIFRIINWLRATAPAVPAGPENLTATTVLDSINLKWQAPAYDGGANVTEYIIYRNGAPIAEVPASQLWYNDTDVVSGQTYTYYVTAVNSVGESDSSNEVQATAPEPVPEFSSLFILGLLAIVIILRRR